MAEGLPGAGVDDFDGVPYEDLAFDMVVWTPERRRHIEQRTGRKGSPHEIDILVGWATEAVADPLRVVGSAGSASRLGAQVVGYSPSAGRVLTVILVPMDRPPAGRWIGATARAASHKERQAYSEGNEIEGREEDGG